MRTDSLPTFTEWPSGDKDTGDHAFYVATPLTGYRLQYLQLVQYKNYVADLPSTTLSVAFRGFVIGNVYSAELLNSRTCPHS